MMKFLKDLFHYFLLLRFSWKYINIKIISSYFGSGITGFYSQMGQDSFIYSEFYHHIKKSGFPKTFLDIGCNHPVKFSNSLFFEEMLNFKVIGVDPLPGYVEDWKRLRPSAAIHSLALGNENSEMRLQVPDTASMHDTGSHPIDMFSTLDKENNLLKNGKWAELTVPVKRTQDFLDEIKVSEIGVMSIDVEGFEMNVLRGLDFAKTKVYIAIIENNSKSRFGSDDIRKYMSQNGFSFYARFWGLDDVYVNNTLKNINEH
jgi:FkbM family methyltransferase